MSVAGNAVLAVIELSVRSWGVEVRWPDRCSASMRRKRPPHVEAGRALADEHGVDDLVRLHRRDVGIDQGEVLADPVADGVPLQRFEDVFVFAEEAFVD